MSKTVWHELEEARAGEGEYRGRWIVVCAPRRSFEPWSAYSSLCEGDNRANSRHLALTHLQRHLKSLKEDVEEAGL